MHGHTGGHIGGGHVPPPSHHPHPGHQPVHHHHGPGDQPWTAGAGRTRLTRSVRDPRITGAGLVVALALVILLLAVFT